MHTDMTTSKVCWTGMPDQDLLQAELYLQNMATQLLARLESCSKTWHVLGVAAAVQRMQAPAQLRGSCHPHAVCCHLHDIPA